MFSSFFSKDPLSNFAYEISQTSCVLASGDVNTRSSSYWALHSARKRGSKAEVDEFSAFVFTTQDKSASQIQLAKQTFRRFKTLRHPNLITYIDGLETEKALYVVTNRIVPLSAYLETNADKCNMSFLASWGTYQVCKALAFLNNDCKLAHGNVNMLSVFVTQKGEWRVGAFDFCVPLESSANADESEALRFRHLERYLPPEWGKNASKSASSEAADRLLAADSFGLACLLYEIFNSGVSAPFKEVFANSERRRMRVPPQIAMFDELCGAYRARPAVAAFAERNSKSDGYFSNFFVSALLFIEELTLKNAAEIIRFLARLDEHMDAFPGDIREHKLLAHLLELFNLYASKPPVAATDSVSPTGGDSQSVQSALLTPIIKIGRSLSVESFQKQITPCLIRMFASPDRQTRVKLLETMPGFVEFLSAAVVNDQLFVYVQQGFSDAHALVRDATIKSSCLLKSKLNAKNLDELAKQLGRVQARDPEGGLRTNAVVCLAKIAGHLAPKTRQSLALAAFLRATKDPFPPARLSAVSALQQTLVFYPLRDLAVKLLPCCTPLLVDPLKAVRDGAFRLVRCCFDKLDKVSENPDAAELLERDLNTIQTGDSSSTQSVSGAESTAGWTGWALTALSSKFYKVPNDKAKAAQSQPQPQPQVAGVSQESAESSSSSAPRKEDANTMWEAAADKPSKTTDDARGPKSEQGWGDTDDWTGSDWGTMRDGDAAAARDDEDEADLESYSDFDARPTSKDLHDNKKVAKNLASNANVPKSARQQSSKASDSNAWESDDSSWPTSVATSQKAAAVKNNESLRKTSGTKTAASDASSWQQESSVSRQASDWNSDAFFDDIAKPKTAKKTAAPVLKSSTATRTSAAEPSKPPSSLSTSTAATKTKPQAKQASNDDGWSDW